MGGMFPHIAFDMRKGERICIKNYKVVAGVVGL